MDVVLLLFVVSNVCCKKSFLLLLLSLLFFVVAAGFVVFVDTAVAVALHGSDLEKIIVLSLLPSFTTSP